MRGIDSDDISQYIDKVVFQLHESFPKPKRGKLAESQVDSVYGMHLIKHAPTLEHNSGQRSAVLGEGVRLCRLRAARGDLLQVARRDQEAQLLVRSVAAEQLHHQQFGAQDAHVSQSVRGVSTQAAARRRHSRRRQRRRRGRREEHQRRQQRRQSSRWQRGHRVVGRCFFECGRRCSGRCGLREQRNGAAFASTASAGDQQQVEQDERLGGEWQEIQVKERQRRRR